MPPHTLNDLSLYRSEEREKPKISYTVDLRRLPKHIVTSYLPQGMDEETRRWLAQARDVSITKILLSDLLHIFFSRTTSNGIVSRGGMFVMSTAQAAQLLLDKSRSFLPSDPPPFDSLLDIGAGDGKVTSKLQPLFRTVSATEYSIPMRWRLWWRGYEVLPYQNPFRNSDGSRRFYNVIACLNVLDRADKPLTLLHSIRESLSPDGILLLSVVLPWCPFVEDGARQRPPSEILPMAGGECARGATFEASLERLVDNVLRPSGFTLVRWCKVPYLCEGNLKVEYAVLNDAVFVLKKSEVNPNPLGNASDI